MASETITIARAELTAEVSRALIGSLNDELRGVYSEPGATHFRLDPEEVTGGRGTFLIVYREGAPVGCGDLRLLDAETAELKRMYVAPTVRGTGLGRRLVTALEAEARALGVRLSACTGPRAADARETVSCFAVNASPRFLSLLIGGALMNRSIVAMVFSALAFPALAQMTPVGVWRTIDDKTGEVSSEVRIADNAGVLSGRIEKLLRKDAKQDDVCDKCADDRKDKPVLGMEIIRGARKTEGRDLWEGGKILDPDNGKEYTLRLTPIEDGKKLQVRGYIAFFFRSQTWIRVQ